jgi:hypothetical protein
LVMITVDFGCALISAISISREERGSTAKYINTRDAS